MECNVVTCIAMFIFAVFQRCERLFCKSTLSGCQEIVQNLFEITWFATFTAGHASRVMCVIPFLYPVQAMLALMAWKVSPSLTRLYGSELSHLIELRVADLMVEVASCLPGTITPTDIDM